MTAAARTVELTSHDAAEAEQLVDQLVEIYLDVYSGAESEFFGEERYRRQLQGHMQAPYWQVVTATVGENLVGYIYGFALPAGTRWWAGLLTTPDADFTAEDGQRTVAISELLVRSPWRRRGIARALHNDFLARRSEGRATLLVEPDNHPATAAYAHWGWRNVGQLRPTWDGAPLYNVLVVDLPHR